MPDEQDEQQEAGRRSRLARKLRNIAVSAVILFMLLLGAGVAYVKYVDGGSTAPPVPVSQTKTPSEIVHPSAPSPHAAEGVAVSSINTPVPRGTQASISVNTNAGSKCSIVLTHDKVVMTAPALKQQTADEFGVAGWTWTVDKSAPTGDWKANVTCAYNKRTGVVIGDFSVT